MNRSSAESVTSWLAWAGVVLLSGCNQMTSQALNSEGVRLYQSGSYQAAADKFQQAVANDPKGATSYYNLAAALHKNGKLLSRREDFDQAERLYNQCLEYDPDHTECYRGLTVLLTETGRQDAAFRLLQGWAQRSPQLADPRIELARLYEETNHYGQATSQLVEAITIDPHNSRALTALGRLREMAGDRAQALANYQRSVAINRFQPEVQARIAALQASGAVTTPVIALPPAQQTQTASQWQPSVRY
ncbi:MAG: tetratricopeptide repeat protein [Planctomycetales bacterium]|nr:tetratricopeptide repeat protein [Planctomycetales bacterium]